MLLFYRLNILLFPVTLVGYAIWVGKALMAGRGSGVSGTAQGPLSARWFCHNLGTRKDEAANRLMLGKAGLDSNRAVLVPADFEKDDWFSQLVAAGFDAANPVLFLWEGVMVYLDEAAVHATFEKIARTARGSAVAFDYFTTDPLESSGLYWRFARAATQASGEPLKFGIDSRPPSRDRLEEFLRPFGLTLAEQRTLGPEAGGGRAWGGFAVATVE